MKGALVGLLLFTTPASAGDWLDDLHAAEQRDAQIQMQWDQVFQAGEQQRLREEQYIYEERLDRLERRQQELDKRQRMLDTRD